MQVRLRDLKVGDCHKMKRATAIVLQIEEVENLSFPIYHLYFIKHREYAGSTHSFTPSTLTGLLKKWA